MTFTEVTADIMQLVGKQLNSILAGAEITLVRVTDDRIELKDSSGRTKTRPISEIRRLWAALCSGPAVHVDSVLGGSSSSRNQPETILANLPYVEWLRCNGKKHIALVESNTHALGTVRRMDTIREQRVIDEMTHPDDRWMVPQTLIVCRDVKSVTDGLEYATGRQITAVEQGIYYQPDSRILIVSDAMLPRDVSPGTYAVTEGRSVPTGGVEAKVGQFVVHVVDDGALRLALLKKADH